MPTHPARWRLLASGEESTILKIGITGHQKRAGADWSWTREELDRILAGCQLPLEGWTSLAGGADQVFALAVLERGGTLVAVIPIPGYERFFDSESDLLQYRRLLVGSQRILYLNHADPEIAFSNAGRRIVEECDLIIAVWDGAPSKGLGGTADAVKYAHEVGRSVIALDPVKRCISSTRTG